MKTEMTEIRDTVSQEMNEMKEWIQMLVMDPAGVKWHGRSQVRCVRLALTAASPDAMGNWCCPARAGHPSHRSMQATVIDCVLSRVA